MESRTNNREFPIVPIQEGALLRIRAANPRPKSLRTDIEKDVGFFGLQKQNSKVTRSNLGGDLP